MQQLFCCQPSLPKTCACFHSNELLAPEVVCSWWLLHPVLPFLVFLEFLVFSPARISLFFFLSDFAFFSRDFRGSVEIKNPCFFDRFPGLFPKKQGKEGQGASVAENPTIIANAPACYRSLSDPSGPKCPGSVSPRVSGTPQTRRHSGDTLETLSEHSGAPVRRASRHPVALWSSQTRSF